MKNLLLLISMIFFMHQTPPSFFEEDYHDAFDFVDKKYNELERIIHELDVEEEVVLSLVFPELIRYAMWRDYFETKANELLYVKKGDPAAFFSIGRYQIKPQFAEKVENYIKENEELKEKYAFICQYKHTGIKEIRRERIERLKSWKWQTRYVSVFCKIMESRFKQVKHIDIEDKIRFYSAAYNSNFLSDSTEIVQWENKISFPYGPGHSSSEFSYAEVAIYFYKNDYHKLGDRKWFK